MFLCNLDNMVGHLGKYAIAHPMTLLSLVLVFTMVFPWCNGSCNKGRAHKYILFVFGAAHRALLYGVTPLFLTFVTKAGFCVTLLSQQKHCQRAQEIQSLGIESTFLYFNTNSREAGPLYNDHHMKM